MGWLKNRVAPPMKIVGATQEEAMYECISKITHTFFRKGPLSTAREIFIFKVKPESEIFITPRWTVFCLAYVRVSR